jgi:hypothetical protein
MVKNNVVEKCVLCVTIVVPIIVVVLLCVYTLRKTKTVETFENVDQTEFRKSCTTPNGCNGWATVDPCNPTDMYNNGFGAKNLCMISEPYNKLANNNISKAGYPINTVYNL